LARESSERAIEEACLRHEEARAALEHGDMRAARRAARRALTLFLRHDGPRSPDAANTLLVLSRVAAAETDGIEATALARRALGMLRATGGDPDLERLRVKALLALAAGLRQGARWAEAERHLRRALRLCEAAFGRHDLDLAAVLNELGMVGKYRAHFADASRCYRRALRIVERHHGDSDSLASLHHNLGGLEHARGRFAAAEPHARRSVVLRERARGKDHPDVAQDVAALAAVLDGRGKRAEAETLYRRALATFERTLGPRHFEVAFNQGNLAALLQARGELDDAEVLYRSALELKTELLGPRHPGLALTLHNLGVLRLERGDRAGARSLVQRALTLARKALGARHPHLVAFRATLARTRAAASVTPVERGRTPATSASARARSATRAAAPRGRAQRTSRRA
jgi:tetratricopeptide (TPR) repeat protein